MELSIPTNRGGISGGSALGMRVKWSRGLAESGRGGDRTSEASFASHSLVNTFWVKRTDGPGLTTVLVPVPALSTSPFRFTGQGLWIGKKKSDF